MLSVPQTKTLQNLGEVGILRSDVTCSGFSHYAKFPIAETAFNLLAQKITQQFARVSQQVKVIEETLNSRGKTDISGLLRKLQLLEREKLQHVRTQSFFAANTVLRLFTCNWLLRHTTMHY